MKELKFKGQYITDENNTELACLEVRDHVPQDEKYVVYLKSVVDYMNANQLRELITAAHNLQPANIVQAGMKKSFIKQMEQKLHDCLMATDVAYRQEFELSQYKERVRILEESLNEELRKRYQIENELFELKHSLQSLPEDKHEENEN